VKPDLFEVAETESSTQPAIRGRRWIARVGRPVLELMVVFVGVYTAFALSEYRVEQEAEAHRDQIRQALIREIEEITFRTRRAAEYLPIIVAFYDSSIAVGAMPPLEPMIEPIRVRSHMWEAALQSGGLNLLDVPTMYRISEFYNALNAGFEQLAQLRELSETVLIPNLGRGPEEFYDPLTKTLRPKYAWYLDGLRRSVDLAVEITSLGEGIVEDLKVEG